MLGGGEEVGVRQENGCSPEQTIQNWADVRSAEAQW